MSSRRDRYRDSAVDAKRVRPRTKEHADASRSTQPPVLSTAFLSEQTYIERSVVRHERSSVRYDPSTDYREDLTTHEDIRTQPAFKRLRLGDSDDEDDDDAEAAPDEAADELRRDQTAQHHLQQFLLLQTDIQDAILEYECPRDVGTLCSCRRGGRRLYRCHDCPLHPPVCSACLLDAHPYEPLHWAEVWTGKCFRKIELCALGKRIYLGHGGLPCPALRTSTDGTKMTTLDTNGVHETYVVFCECADNVGSHTQALQLVRNRLFPYTTEQPETIVTFRCLHDFHIHTNASRKSAHDYMKALLRMTSEDSRIKNSHLSQHFIRLMRLWRFLAAERESGQFMKMDNLSSFRPPGSFAEVCLACPVPRVNMTPPDVQVIPRWPLSNKTDILALEIHGPDAQAHLRTIFIAMDGNFKLINLEKNNNLDDPSLWNGRGFFRAREELEAHMVKHYNIKIEKGKCRKFAAIEHWNTLRHKGQVVSGVMMVFCRHGLVRPDSATNLKRGEKFICGDYSLYGALQNTEEIEKLCLAYDIICQYAVNLMYRWDIQFPHKLFPSLLEVIGKMHSQTHVESCQYCYSLYYTRGVGRTDGEEAERFWAEMNQVAGSTKQMNPGHRGDTLDDCINDYNRTKLLQHAMIIEHKYPRTLQRAESLALKFDVTDATFRIRYTDAVVNSWVERGTNWYLTDSGDVDSPFKSKNPTLSLEDQLKAMTLLDSKDESDSVTEANRMPMVIAAGIKLQQRQRIMKGKIEHMFDDALLPASSLRHDILRWRAHLYDTCPGLQEYLDETDLGDVVADIKLSLPSYFSAEDRHKYELKHQAATELELRRGEAFDIIRNLRTALRLMAQHNYKTKKYGGTRNTNTRLTKPYKEARKMKIFWISEYEAVYSAMLVLGLSPDDNTFQPLTEKDFYRPDNLEPSEFCAKEIGWIWTVSDTGGLTSNTAILEWEKEDDRVQWYRQWAARDRWREEVELLDEELKRLVRGFIAMANVWQCLSKDASLGGKSGRAAFANRKELSYRIASYDAWLIHKKLGLEWHVEEPDEIKNPEDVYGQIEEAIQLAIN